MATNRDDEFKVTGEDILREIGYYRDDTMFMSLNLSPEQLLVVSDASVIGCEQSPEEMIIEALKCWMESKAPRKAAVA